jgi:hypothetical protein
MAREATGAAWKRLPDKAAMAFAMFSIAMIAAQSAAAQINPYRQTAGISGSDSDDGPARTGARVPGLSGFSGRGLAVSASMNSRYEDNLSRLSVPDDGFRIQPLVSASYGLGSNRLRVFAAGSYGRDIVRGNQLFQGGDRSSLSGGLDFASSRCSGELGASFRKSLNLRADAALFGAFQQQNTTLGVAADCRIGSALTASASISKSNDRNDQGASQALNVESLNYSASLGYNANALGQISLGGAIAQHIAIHAPERVGRLVLSAYLCGARCSYGGG